jgi:hypothetical protein
MRVERDFEDFIELLNRHEVRYLVIGAYAVAFHSRPRYTGDIDFLVEPDRQNAKRVLNVLREFGFGGLDITIQDLLNPDVIIQLGMEPNRIDLLKSIPGVDFGKAYRSKVSVRFGNSKAWFISFDDLLKNKRLTTRKKDEADAELLENFRKVSTKGKWRKAKGRKKKERATIKMMRKE